MQLLTLDEVRLKLEHKYAPMTIKYPEHFIFDFPRVAKPNAFSEILLDVEKAFSINLPKSFLEILKDWNLGLLDIANFQFGKSGDYGQALVKNNSDKCCPRWWEDQDQYIRPASQLMIAQSDPYVAVLNCDTGEILAYVSDEGAMSAEVVASDITAFIRGLGTIEILSSTQADIDAWCKEIRALVGDKSNSEFWRENINHWAEV